MKKVLFVIAIMSVCLFTSGCMKNYKTVSEYNTAMNEVKAKLQDYTINATVQGDDKEVMIKSYTKNNGKWKTEISENNGATYRTGIIYDGNEVLSYDMKSKTAMIVPFFDKLSAKEMGENEYAASIMKILNPVGILFNWSFEEFGADLDKDWKFGVITKKNNFPCRMIYSSVTNSEVCVNDKYGIAVYAKFTDKKRHQTKIINVSKIDNSAIADDVIQLPEGVKKKSFEDLFADMANALKGMGSKAMPRPQNNY